MDRPDWQKILDLLLAPNSEDWELGYLLLLPLLASKKDRDLHLSMVFALVLFSPIHRLKNKEDNGFDKKLRKLLQQEDAYFHRKLSVLQHKIYAISDKYASAPEIQYIKMMELLDFERFQSIVLPAIFNHRLTFFGGKYLQLAQWQLSHLLSQNQLNTETIQRCLVSKISRQYLGALDRQLKAPQIQQLNLHFFIPKISRQLNQLLLQYKSIALLKNGFTELPKALYQNKNLAFLYLANNPIETLDQACQNWTQLCEMRFSFCRLLHNFPSDMSSLSALKRLTIEHCRLQEVPESLFDLKNLTALELSRNKISHIPNKLEQLQQLDLLNLNQNLPLGNIPNSVYQLKQLKQLWLKDCGLNKIPKEIVQMKALQDLRLSDNQIKFLPPNFTDLEHLEQLQLERTNIRCDESFWESILNLKSLKHLLLFGVPVRADIYLQYKDALKEKLSWFDIHEHYLY